MLNNVVKSAVQIWSLSESHIDHDNSTTTLRELHPLPRDQSGHCQNARDTDNKSW